MSNNDYDEFLKELDVFLNNQRSNVENVCESKGINEPSTINSHNILSKKSVKYSDIKVSSISINDLNDTDKPREKLVRKGVEKLSEEELIAILLGSGSKKEDVLTVSKKLWTYISSLHRYSELNINDLMTIDGIGLSKASTVIAALEFSKRLNVREKVDEFSVNSPKSVVDIFMNILKDELKEHFYVILLDTKNKIISWDEISKGDLNSSIVHPREVFKYALKLSANSIICLHNHPSGDPTPSVEDIKITKRLNDVGRLMGIELVDHIIIGYNKYVSLREKGIIN
ncbi:MAG: DNA repair protein RadC [Peptoniphilaceae bacterium]|uniref:RadC family protein n=1 Tax=Parvimonas sp. TaxID=1944660 RepID=UPI0025E01D47|nr:DNA repair protein RadC [Parvimonas sp.]MCI5997761.1 DNA repair protein RadC [Parvimonas sp.]MDD7765314.1 DNA repair protein RadC [Peptoniphilaceae bacterium]MDY3050926.1 DNA repair protein RadC [Parvimonas sp.]